MLRYEIVICFNISLLSAWTEGQKTRRRCSSMKKYELCVVVTTKIEDEERAAVIEKVKALIARFGGNVTNVDEWGKRKLAYEIQKMKEGFYYFITFESDSNCPNEVEQRVRIMEDVIRYLCIRQDA
jgi:small subunit ribosomal protein S6